MVNIDNVYYHFPYKYFEDKFDLVLDNKVNIEIYFDADSLDSMDEEKLKKYAEKLNDNGLSCIFHAPFRNLNLGASDRKIREITVQRISSLLDYSSIFSAKSIVIHSGYDQIYHDKLTDKWLARAQESLDKIRLKAEELGVVISVENAIETSLDPIIDLIETQKSENIKLCFDIGHYNVFFKKDISDAIEKYKDYIYELHVSDNKGDEDSHFALGKGNIDFDRVFSKIKKLGLDVVITSEPHCPDDLLENKKFLEKILL